MRIIAGTFKGRVLESPSWEGLRPTSDRLRETLFDILGTAIIGARVLEGYAGTGALGIEALSRGAGHVTFVERDSRATRLIQKNLARLSSGGPELDGRYAIIRAAFADAVGRLSPGAFDLIVLDPPYAESAASSALEAVAPLATPATRLILEHAARHAALTEHAGFSLQRTVRAGDSALSFYARR